VGIRTRNRRRDESGAAFYLVGGVVAMGVQIAAQPQSTIPNLGASGAIATVMGAFLIAYPRDRIRAVLIIGWFVRITFIPAALLIGFWFVIQLFSLGVVAEVESGGVAYMAHIGGMVFGVATTRLFEDPYVASGRAAARRMIPRRSRADPKSPASGSTPGHPLTGLPLPERVRNARESPRQRNRIVSLSEINATALTYR
jgi:Rhomboid family